jgi:hypothetical protein
MFTAQKRGHVTPRTFNLTVPPLPLLHAVSPRYEALSVNRWLHHLVFNPLLKAVQTIFIFIKKSIPWITGTKKNGMSSIFYRYFQLLLFHRGASWYSEVNQRSDPSFSDKRLWLTCCWGMRMHRVPRLITSSLPLLPRYRQIRFHQNQHTKTRFLPVQFHQK